MPMKGKSLVIAQEFRRKILHGEMKPGDKFDAVPVLASRFNTTLATISKVFDILSTEGLVNRINGSGVFVNQPVTKRFAVVFDSQAENGAFAQKSMFMSAFIKECRKSEIGYTVFDFVDSEADCERVQHALNASVFDGIIISSRVFALNYNKYLKNIPISAIGLYDYQGMENTISFSFDWVNDAVKRLKAQGCRRIAMFSLINNDAVWRKKGGQTFGGVFASACKARRIKGQEYCLPHSPREAFKVCSEFLDNANSDEQIGILVTDSILTYGVLSAVLMRGLMPGVNLPFITHANASEALCEFPVKLEMFKADITQLARGVLDFFLSAKRKSTKGRDILLELSHRDG
ncbi:MAG: GntR family transcriptional regulator [Victivallales bacterium]|nr:GntR family transcriptional regulator [Victivallales bacterium]